MELKSHVVQERGEQEEISGQWAVVPHQIIYEKTNARIAEAFGRLFFSLRKSCWSSQRTQTNIYRDASAVVLNDDENDETNANAKMK